MFRVRSKYRIRGMLRGNGSYQRSHWMGTWAPMLQWGSSL